MKKNKSVENKTFRDVLIPLSLLLIGLVLITETAGSIIIFSALNLSPISAIILVSWFYALLKFIAGIASMMTGIMILKK